ncbi:MAG: hypothetical protein LIP00_00875 [Parabacteroides sp.]|nr:hypothetical protein [Parabacteroides sp.]
MKTMKYLTLLLAVVAMGISLGSCGDDDDDKTADMATTIAGDYSGKLQVVGYTEMHQAYVTLTRRSETAVSLVMDCDEINFHSSPVILDITKNSSSYSLNSTSKAVNGSVVNGNLSIAFASNNDTYTFYGTK